MTPKRIEVMLRDIENDLKVINVLLENNQKKATLFFAQSMMSKIDSLEKCLQKTYALSTPLMRDIISNNSELSQIKEKVSAWSSDYSKVKEKQFDSLNYDLFIEEIVCLHNKQIKCIRRKFGSSYMTINAIRTSLVLGGILLLMVIGFIYNRIQSNSRGLNVEYYSGINFRNLLNRGKSQQIDFMSAKQLPSFVPKDAFSVRWTGYLVVPDDGEYEFSFVRDNGLKFYIDDRILIDEWTDSVGKPSVKAQLSKGSHSIKVEFFEAYGKETLQFYWAYKGGERKIVEAKYFKPKI